jgi:peroxiredoxin
MRNFALSALLACSFAVLPTNYSSAAPEAPAAETTVGQKAPDFSLTDINGKTVKLSDFQHKFVVLEWFNDGCPFVKKHYESGNMQGVQKEFTKKGVIWLSICSSGPGQQGSHDQAEFKKILKNWNSEPTHLLLDADGKIGHLYGAKTTPGMYVIGKDGTLLYKGAIDDKPDTDKESIKGAKNYVREALDQAMAGKSVATTVTKSYGCRVHYAG